MEPTVLPFQVLSAVRRRNPSSDNHEIINEPSASALALLRATNYAKTTFQDGRGPGRSVFDADDPESHPKLYFAANTFAGNRIPRFSGRGFLERADPATARFAREADAIISVAPWWSGLRALGFDAAGNGDET